MTEQSLKEIINFIDEAKIYYLATVDGDQPKRFCLLLCSIVFSLGGCRSTTSVSEMTSQDAQSQEVITAENTDESAAFEGDDVSEVK